MDNSTLKGYLMPDDIFTEQKKSHGTSYMHFVILTLFVTTGLIFVYIPYFILHIFPQNREIIYKIKSADDLFKNKEYFDALVSYMNLVNEHQNFEHGIKQIVLCSFSLIDTSDDNDYFDLGVYYLRRLPILDKYLMKDIEEYLPESHKEQFKRLLK